MNGRAGGRPWRRRTTAIRRIRQDAAVLVAEFRGSFLGHYIIREDDTQSQNAAMDLYTNHPRNKTNPKVTVSTWYFRVQANVEQEEQVKKQRRRGNLPETDHWWKRTRSLSCLIVVVFKSGVVGTCSGVFAPVASLHLVLFLSLPQIGWMIFLSWVPISSDLDRRVGGLL